MVSFINRNAADKNILDKYKKIIIVGQMKSGKTREAAKIIQRAIDTDLVNIDHVYEPS